MAAATALPIGAHVPQDDPVAEADARGADLVQLFLGDPQGYQGPEVRYAGGTDALCADAEPSEHAPDDLAAIVRDGGAPVVGETPGGAEEHTADPAFLRDRV